MTQFKNEQWEFDEDEHARNTTEKKSKLRKYLCLCEICPNGCLAAFLIFLALMSFGFICSNVSGASTGTAQVLISFDSSKASTLTFKVMMDPMEQNGEDVTVNFYSPDIKNNGVFFTDANGLEMQKRTLNERQEYGINIAEGMNITSNFYPVTSAVAIRDDKL